MAAIDGIPIGYAVVDHRFFGHPLVALLVVDPAYRRRGIASKLLSAVEAASTGDRLFTSSNASNMAAQRLFAKAGFARSGTIDHVDEGDPELIFHKLCARPSGGLRQATLADIAAIHTVRMSVRENRLTHSVISERHYIDHLETLGRGWVIEVQGRIVAFAIGNARNGNIRALFVHPDFERRGFGRRLLDAVVEWLWTEGATRLWLTTAPATRAQDFYESAGWVNVGMIGHGEVRFELETSSEAR